ncbi:uncharacterized protein EI97DRAFT_368224 [Westerdykella ornata]|uniref:AHC1-like C2H2 zinc-finger domain-containing protein n=1 Tax=Westerdykella ornata TaxID=318751 RepID=A0A6A6JZR3_WESOR|nr:uncharacterized protein EI97DRAFT_368224 [Westerdykella ornata]KAF2280569.1 hypothetical protein EI97DRAFT_368224 [Westerdykella ornata]
MQSMFRLPWSTESPADKFMDKAALHKPRPVSLVEIPNLVHKLKRKRSHSPEPALHPDAHAWKKWKGPIAAAAAAAAEGPTVDPNPDPAIPTPSVAATSNPLLDAPSEPQPLPVQGPTPTTSTSTGTTMESSLSSVRQAIEAQFNLEILVKHNELRVIEQELAKCQVALEQLRRCSLIPFPGTQGPSQDVLRGVGAAIQPPTGYTTPQFAAPWGVTDGPYTRHYAKWLLSDPRFDPIPEHVLAQQSQASFGYGEGRTTRGSFADFCATGKARTSRTSTGTLKLQALGENPPPAPKIDPLLHKRSTDGQWVRLYCAECGHSNFSNTQGFLNHCRIKHLQVFKSHDQAAIACGIPVDVNEAGQPVTATEPPSTVATTPAATSIPTPVAPGSVHPLVRSDPPQSAPDVHREFDAPPRSKASESRPTRKVDFTQSSSTPYLNSLLAKRGFEGDLKGLVESARTRVDLSSLEPSDEDKDVSVSATPTVERSAQALVRVPNGTSGIALSKAANVWSGRKGQGSAPSRLPAMPDVAFPGPGRDVSLSPVELSPHTVDSNPGLVSDHDDDDEEDGYDARSQPDVIMEDHVVVEDASDVEGAHERAGSRKVLPGCFEKGGPSQKA